MKRQQKTLYIAGGCAAAAVIIAIVLLLVLGGGKSYEKHYQAAQTAFLQKDYDTSLKELDKAMEIDASEECYLLMANVYYAQGDTDMAVQVLYLGYSHTGSAAVSRMLEDLKAEQTSAHTAPVQTGVTIGGASFDEDVTSAVLSEMALGNEDIRALSALTALEELSLSGNDLSDIAPLAALTELTTLQLSDNRISDLSPLSGLRALKTLYLDGNPVTDFTALESLSSLRTLSIKSILITDAALAALQQALPGCRIYSDEPAKSVPEITLGGRTFRADVTELSLGGRDIDDISALAACTQLRDLDLRDNKITDLSPLAELTELERLCLWNNQVEDLTPLLDMTQLQYLDIDTNAVSDILPLARLTSLEELWLNNNPLHTVEPLRGLTALTRLGLKNVGLSDDDYDILMDLSELKELALEENEGLSQTRFDALQEALPKCVISHSELIDDTEPEPETTDAPQPAAPDAAYLTVGANAAVEAAGSGSGYAVLWDSLDPASAGIRAGFVAQAKTLSMNVVADLSFADIEAEAEGLAIGLQVLGADVLLLAADDEVLATLFTALQSISYMPRIIQVYN